MQATPILPKRQRRLAGSSGEPLESDVVRAISDLLAVHPLVAIALRMNSGMASYNARNGNTYQPVFFHKWLRRPEKMKMPDFIGWLNDGTFFAIEAKRSNWTGAKDDREREQQAFLRFVAGHGGRSGFARSVWDAEAILEGRSSHA